MNFLLLVVLVGLLALTDADATTKSYDGYKVPNSTQSNQMAKFVLCKLYYRFSK
jgi:hypothetical protein